MTLISQDVDVYTFIMNVVPHRAYIIRHAQSINTANWRWNRDHPDELSRPMIPADQDGLSDAGQAQVKDMIAHLPLDAEVRCANSQRAKETAAMFSQPTVVPALNELSKFDYIDTDTDEHKGQGDEAAQVDQWIREIKTPSNTGSSMSPMPLSWARACESCLA